MRRLTMSWIRREAAWSAAGLKRNVSHSQSPTDWAFQQARESVDAAVHLAESSNSFWIWQGCLIGTPSPVARRRSGMRNPRSYPKSLEECRQCTPSGA
jgi:hypothetical protein